MAKTMMLVIVKLLIVYDDSNDGDNDVFWCC